MERCSSTACGSSPIDGLEPAASIHSGLRPGALGHVGGRPQLCSAFYLHNPLLKEVDLYSAFIVVPHTQGAQVRITQYYLQITPYLPLPRKHSPDGASPD